jgi:hypothetical protein
MECKTVKVKCDNDAGFYICNADSVPEGSSLYGSTEAVKDAPKKRGRKPKGN